MSEGSVIQQGKTCSNLIPSENAGLTLKATGYFYIYIASKKITDNIFNHC
jgi:hypothetical protein